MEFEAEQPSQQDAGDVGDVVQEAAERALVELVNVRHMEVKRLERELEELRTHCEHLFQSFSVPTFPPGYNPDLRVFEDTPEHGEGGDDYKEGDDIPPTHLPVPSRRGGVAEESQNEVGGISKSHEKDREPNDDSEDKSKDGLGRGGRLKYLKDHAHRKNLTNSLDQAATSSEMCLCRADVEESHCADHERNRPQTLSCPKLSEVPAVTFSRHLKQFAGSPYGDGKRCPLHPEVQRRSPAKILEQTFSPANRNGNEVEFLDEADNVEEVRMKSPAKALNEFILTSSSPSPSPAPIVTNGIEWGNVNAVDVLKEEIRREKRGLKSPVKSPAKPLENFRISPGKTKVKLESTSSSSSEESSSWSEETSSQPADMGLKIGSPMDSTSEEAVLPEASSSSGSDISSQHKPSPVKLKTGFGEPLPKITWQPKKKALSSSSGSDESSSESDEDVVRRRRHTQNESLLSGRGEAASLSKVESALRLPCDASPEDLFDWTILGLQGPWMPLTSEDKISGASELKEHFIQLKFPSRATYISTFQKLIAQEAKAILCSEWNQYTAEQDSHGGPARESSSANVFASDSRGLSTQWRLRNMVQTGSDPFHYIEAEWVEGPIQNLSAGEFLCMVLPKTNDIKGLAIVNYEDRSRAPLLRTKTPWDNSLGQCVLLRLCNMVTLRRMFLAVSTLSDIFSPLQQQLLDPMANIKFMAPVSAPQDAIDDYANLKLKSETLRNFNARKILNTMQLLTVSGLLHMRQGFQLVQGPPGTGKTSTIVGIVSALMIEEPGAKVLICAPSNAALDEIAARLMHHMLDKAGNRYSPMDGALVRFGSKRVMHPLVQSVSLDSLGNRLSSSSNQSRSWVEILDGASVVCATLSGCGNTIFDELERMFDVLIVDEAAQAVEAEVLIALKRLRGRCVMVGDPQQLPATVFQRPGTAFGRSLFERLQEGGLPVSLLTTQYRMHPSISFFPSQRFYNSALKDSLRTKNMLSIFKPEFCSGDIVIHGCRFKLGHYCFMDVGWGIEREEIIGHSRANFEEALVVCNAVEGVVKGLLPGLKLDLGIITPYIAQRGVIEHQLEKRGIDFAACEVNTVDGFQGREKDVIVLSCVRAMADRGLGFVSDEKRMNVALTRAKYSLIIVGHAETLQKWSPSWSALLDDARKRGCYQMLTNKKAQDFSTKNRQNRPNTANKSHGAAKGDNGHVSQVTKNKWKSQNGGVSQAGKVSHRDDEDTLVIEDPDKHSRKKRSKKAVRESADVEMAVMEEVTDQRPKGKRKREMVKLEIENNDSGGQQEATAGKKKKKLKVQDSSPKMPLVTKKLLQVAETMPESPPIKKKKARAMDESPDVVVSLKKKKKKASTETTSMSPTVKKKKKKVSTQTTLMSPTVKRKKKTSTETTRMSPTVKKKKLKLREEGSPDSTLKVEGSESPIQSASVKKKKKKLKLREEGSPDSTLKVEGSESPIQSASVKKKKLKLREEGSPDSTLKVEGSESPIQSASVKKKKKKKEQKVLPECSLVKVEGTESPVHLASAKKKKIKKQEVPRESTLVKVEVNESPSQVASVKKKKEHWQELSAQRPSKALSVRKNVVQELESVPESRIVPYNKDNEEKEVIVYEVTSTSNGVDPVRRDSDILFYLNSEAPILPIPTELPRGTASWRNTRPSREWFPKAQSEQDGQFQGGARHSLPLNHHQSVQSGRPANNTGNFAIGREYLQPHWGNSYGRGGNQATHAVNKFEVNTHNFSTPPSQSYNRDQLWGNLQHNQRPGNWQIPISGPNRPHWKWHRGQSSVPPHSNWRLPPQ